MSHSIISPSSLDRVWECPGSATIVSLLPEQPANQYMAQGSAAHLIAEWILKGLTVIPPTIECDGFTFDVVDEEGSRTRDTVALEYVHVYTDYIKEFLAQYPNATQFVETKIKVFGKDLDGSDRKGTVDWGAWVPCVMLKAVDLKYGAGVIVEVEKKKQLLDYLLGLWDMLEDWQKAMTPIIEMTIVQPRGMGSGISHHHITPDELEQYRYTLTNKLNTAHQARAEYGNVPAEQWENNWLAAGEWCESTFCPYQANCSKLTAKMSQLPMADFANLLPVVVDVRTVRGELDILPSQQIPRQLPDTLPTPSEMPDEWLLKVKEYKATLESWANACEDELNRRALNGRDYTELGYKLVETRTNRKLLPSAATILKAHKNEIYQEPKLKTLKELDKICGPELMAKATYKPEGKKVLAKLSDVRKSVELPKATDDFKNLVEVSANGEQAKEG